MASMIPFRSMLPVLLAGASAILACRDAAAQSATDMGARRDLLHEAERARGSGDHARALDYAQRAGAIQMTPSVRMFIAQENRALEQVIAALDSSDACIRETERDASARNRDAILAGCRDVLSWAQQHVGRVVVNLPPGAPTGLRVLVAGHELNPNFYGVPYVVAPGSVLVEARAPGFRPFRAELNVGVQTSTNVAVRLEPDPSVAASGVASEPPPPPEPSRRAAIPMGAVATLGAGAVALGVSAVFLVVRNSTWNATLANCQTATDGLHCAPSSETAYQRAETWNTLTNVALVAGGVAVVGGAVWLLLGRTSERRPVVGYRIDVGPASGGGAWVGISGSL